ncbi:neural cell adhesion molecule 2-like isoform X2 [Megalops cyprinoides]|uniref:neural cell adhesion molecule 2-like isoform X2 n=1 Tax=Megalops cyprinoides TaxID=118141 RepID=UPI001864648B|nr:neural cell adhesion molecule 2-like isoform X2 [Megalops cyprinoides]
MLLILACFLGLLVRGGQAVLQVSISLNKVELSVGESKFFTCTAIGEPVSVDWYNPQGERIVSSQRVVLHKEGVRSRLTIYNVNIEDAGIYRCQATDGTGQTQEATVVLEIYQKLTFREVQSPQEFRQGEVAEVVCDVISSPVPIVSWFYNEREITEEYSNRLQVLPNNNLQIDRVTKADEGVYRCEARVEARGEIDFRDIAVIVNVPPVLSVPQQSFNATADYQESVTFTCRAYGSPDPEITWHRRGKQIEQSDQYTLKGSGSMLTVRNIRQDDGGAYTCKASNKAGVAEQELLLKVFVQPHITQLQNVTAKEGSTAIISCTAEGEPIPEISWRRASDGRTFGDGDKSLQSADGRVKVQGLQGKSMLTISGVALTDRGRFDCEALSRIGGHQKSMYLDIEYTPIFLSNHTIYYSWEGNPVNLSCEVMANPAALLLWRRDRLTVSTEGPGNARVYSTEGRSLLEVTPMSEQDFGRYNCTAMNSIGTRVQEFILAQADVPSNPYAVRIGSVSQRVATVTFMKPDSHGGVPISYYLVRYRDTSSQHWSNVQSHGVETMVLLTSLEPNTTYEVQVAAVNGKGQGEFSHVESFQTLPIREPSPPTVHGQRGVGKAYRLGLVRQDDGGMPIVEYIIKYKTEREEQWMTKLVPGGNDFVLLQPLQWNTRYEVEITARNVKGLSVPTYYQFSMPQRPDITDSLFNGLGLGAVVGLAVAALLLVLVGVDVACFFLRHCGVLMCITRKLRGKKKSATCSKGKDLEEGKAAYLNAGSKEPIVEMRTEEERIANPDDVSPGNEPNETTPLTEPEKLPLKEENGKDSLKTEAIEIKIHGDSSVQSRNEDSKA